MMQVSAGIEAVDKYKVSAGTEAVDDVQRFLQVPRLLMEQKVLAGTEAADGK